MSDFPITVLSFDEAVAEFERMLLEDGTWVDMNPTNVGSFIKRMVAGVGVSHQYNIYSAARQAFYQTATRDSSIYALSRSQGLKIQRMGSSVTTSRMYNGYSYAVVVAPYSEHRIGSVRFYNKRQYTLPAGTSLDVVLTQGVVKEKTFVAQSFREILLNEPGFFVTDDILITVTDNSSGTQYTFDEANGGLYEYTGNDRVYFESTTASGDVSFIFGDGEFGAALPLNATVGVRYVITEGDVHNGIMPGAKVVYSQLPLIQGQTVETSAGGAAQKSAQFYKQFGPHLYRARKKLISPEEIRAAVNEYPGVADCVVLGQRQIAPEDKTWMNTMRICVLPSNTDSWGGANPNPKSGSWQNFLTWLTPQLHSLAEVQTWNATKAFVEVEVVVAVHSRASARIAQMRTQMQENILRLFRKRPGILKRRITKSDIEDACRMDGVDYIEVLSPLENSVVLDDPTQYCVLLNSPVVNIVISEREEE